MTSPGARTAAVTTSVLSTSAITVVMVMHSGWTPHLPASATMRQWIADPMSSGVVALLVAAAAVTLWLLLATAVLTHAYAALARRLRWAPAIRLPGPVQGLTAALLGATAVTTATGAVAHAAPATTTSDEPAVAGQATASPASHRPAASHQPAAPPPTYTVRRGDSLCEIAARTLGDADRWPEIFALNRGARFPHVGGVLRNPDLIYPGWVLRLPADATHRSDQTPPRGRGQQPRTEPGRPDLPAPPTKPDSSAGTPKVTTTTTAGPTAPATGPPLAGPKVTASTPGTAGMTPPSRSASNSSARDPLPTPQRSSGIDVPGGSWVDIGLAAAICAAAALVWAHRRRRYTPRPPSTATHLEGPDTTPMPTVVTQIRRRLRDAAPRTAIPATTGHQRHDLHSSPDPIGGNTGPDAALDGEDHTSGNPTHVPRPAVPSLAHPLAETWPSAGLGLTGPAPTPLPAAS
ncbi:hypothetical protein DRA43_01295 [Micromonospora provocatoris]|nr:LysM peptidoglycan-binding domain-containing protein [Micromonospora provocatoris]RBJ11106.1 hypothetical protein DRA43_01295 [Micromonospora provocatoris]